MKTAIEEIFEKLQQGAVSHTYPWSKRRIVENSPFMFVGKWFETTWYINGKVKEINEDDPVSILTTTYDVSTRFGLIKTLKSTDLYEYELEEQVTLIKRWDGKPGDFFYRDIQNSENWTVIPVEFEVK